MGSATGTTLTATIGAKSISVIDTTYASGTIGVLINPGNAVGPHIADDFCAAIGTGAAPDCRRPDTLYLATGSGPNRSSVAVNFSASAE